MIQPHKLSPTQHSHTADHRHDHGHDHGHDHDHDHDHGHSTGHGRGTSHGVDHDHRHRHSNDHINDHAHSGNCHHAHDAKAAVHSHDSHSANGRAGTSGGVAVAIDACCGHDHAATPQSANLPPPPAALASGNGTASTATTIRILQMDCPTEEGLIRNKLGTMAGIHGMEFNLMARTITVAHAASAAAPMLQAIRTLGFTPEIIDRAQPAPPPVEAPKPWWPLALAGVAALAAEAVDWAGLAPWLSALLALAAIAGSGLGTYRKGWIALRNGNLNINALMSIAVTGALLLRHWPEAAMVMVLFTLAERIEALSLERARHAIRGLMELAPDTALVQQGDGQWVSLPARDVALGARVRVRPGERIALDGVIVEGRTSVNQAPITGESLPVDKHSGDSVFAGTINAAGAFDYRVSAVAGSTTLDRIIHAVEQAQAARAPTQRWVDRFARVYTPVVLVIAAALAVLPPLAGYGLWLDWIYKALVLLVIACPCALVISTPVSIVSALAAAARKGILIKGGAFLEQGRHLRHLALDKTGTLTLGRPIQTDWERVGAAPTGIPADDLRSIAASLASRSDHPVSHAIAQAAQSDGVALREVAAFEALPGRGVRGRIDGQSWSLGNWRLVLEMAPTPGSARPPEGVQENLGAARRFLDLDLASTPLRQRLDELEGQGKSVVLLIGDTAVHALFAVADTVKPGSRDAIAQIHALGIRTVMLSGDNPQAARAIGAEVGVSDVRANQLPDDKRQAIEALAAQGVVGMVGDGINDAPALARADLGFAMGALGTDTAIETADVALMDDDLAKIAQFVRLSRATHGVLVQNIVLALGIKLLFLALAVAGLATMWMAVFADVGASLLVVANGLRLLRK